METPYYFEIINQERRNEIKMDVDKSRPYFLNTSGHNHMFTLVKKMVVRLGKLLVNAWIRLKDIVVHPEVEYSTKS